MASGSYFTLLRKTKNNLKFSDKFIEEFIIHKYKEAAVFNTTLNVQTAIEDMKKGLCDYHQISTFKYLSLKDNYELDVIMELHFTSGFKILKEEFNMNSYNVNCIKVFDINLCKQMKIALDYILSRDYSKKFEDILDNYYIEMFGNEIPYFQYRFNNNFVIPDGDLESEELIIETDYYYKKLRDLFASYILIDRENTLNEAEYYLLYTCF